MAQLLAYQRPITSVEDVELSSALDLSANIEQQVVLER
jgi:hypothetical protein